MTTLVASDVMERNLISVPPGMTLADLAELLIRERVTGVPVVDANQNGAVVGIISRSDVVRFPVVARTLAELVADREKEIAAARSGDLAAPLPAPVMENLAGYTVRDAMVANPLSVAPQTPLAELARLLVTRHMHRVLVRDGSVLVGLISSLDIARLVAEGRLVPA